MSEFWNGWQHLPAKMSPVLFQIGPVKVQYYGLMYIVAFGITYMLVISHLKRQKGPTISVEQVQNLFTAMIVGLMVGARFGYVIFYHFSYYLHHPLEVILPFSFSDGLTYTGIAGMSFHGGGIGITVAVWLYARKTKLGFLRLADLVAPNIPLGYTFGRIGNFINGELFGRVTEKPWGMYFPHAPTHALRHPSQLYEAFFEGIFLFGILWVLKSRVRTPGRMLALYLIGYGAIRFVIEFFRQPDAHLGFVLPGFSMGQILCVVMMLTGAGCFMYSRQK
jgi:phosphatidylglycerol:prolipoprotein diacylglycerol transferase